MKETMLFLCPHCQKELRLPPGFAEPGELIECPSCNESVTVPSPPQPLVKVRQPLHSLTNPSFQTQRTPLYRSSPKVLSSAEVLKMKELELKERELALRELELRRSPGIPEVRVEGKSTARTLKAIGSVCMILSVFGCGIGSETNAPGMMGIGMLLFWGGFILFVIGRFYD